MTDKDHLIWTNEYDLWWKADRKGYTTNAEYAGRYTKEEAERIASEENYRAGSTLDRRKLRPEVAVSIADLQNMILGGETTFPLPYRDAGGRQATMSAAQIRDVANLSLNPDSRFASPPETP